MKYSHLEAFIVAVCLTSLSAVLVEAERGLVITFPETVYLNSTEKVCFTAANVSGNMQVRARLVLPGYAHPFSTWMGTERDGCVDISTNTRYYRSRAVPRTGELLVEWSVERTPGSLFVEKTYRKSVTVAPVKNQTFIQSDKPIYQPGQKVLFRVLTVLYPKLLPDTENKKDVWITSPGGTRMQQWRDQVSSDGLLDMAFELLEESELGNWTIHVQVHGGRTTIQEFKVQEYGKRYICTDHHLCVHRKKPVVLTSRSALDLGLTIVRAITHIDWFGSISFD
ncbi:ovostatin [Strongylocentrotus purpuratus]|uniref:Macroglobulin domain-containing protein n=1 Tax=Strongylocentrotus purpuratus TaxID=7668 RepID=A0A7M7P3J4_STRPU|nr:ovostatin [Strongylocentrotus purpuratus]